MRVPQVAGSGRAAADTADRRILVLGGHAPTRAAAAYPWDALPPGLNIADYDTVVLNFVPLGGNAYAAAIDIDRLPTPEQFSRLMFSSGSSIIAIGSPEFRIGSNPFVGSDWWLPVEPQFVHEQGEEVRAVARWFEDYFSQVKRWTFYLDHVRASRNEQVFARACSPLAEKVSCSVSAVAETRFHRAIGFKMQFQALAPSAHRREYSTVKRSGEVIWLPEPTEGTVEDGIRILLKSFYGIETSTKRPEWAGLLHLPAELPILARMQERETQLGVLKDQLAQDTSALANANRLVGLLFEQGEAGLEPLARDALRQLGAQVAEPTTKGREDGRVVDPAGRQFMLEVKGRTGTLRLSDVRELDQWVRDAVLAEDWNGKGLLVCNLKCTEHPALRRDVAPPISWTVGCDVNHAAVA